MDWSLRYNYNFPTSIRFGAGVTDELSDHLKSVSKKHPLLVTDPMLPTLDFFQEIVEHIKDAGMSVSVFSQIDKNPIEKNVLEGEKSIFH